MPHDPDSHEVPLDPLGSPGDIIGSPEGIFGEPEDARCCEDRICKCLGRSQEIIAEATRGIWAIMLEQQQQPCDKILQCIDEIIEKLREKMEGPAASCEECTRMAANGLRGTFEYALQCAGACVAEAEKACSLSDPEGEGKPCTTADGQRGICENGVCVPLPEEEQEELKFVAWCNQENGLIQVTSTEDEPLPSPWLEVGLTSTEAAAVALARANCTQGDIEIPPAVIEPFPVIGSSSKVCGIDLFTDPTRLGNVANHIDTAIVQGGASQLFNAFGNLGLGGISLGNFGAIVDGIGKFYGEFQAATMTDILPGVASLSGCDNPDWQKMVWIMANVAHVNRFLGVDLNEFMWQYRYAMHAMCRQRYLDPQQATTAYMGNALSEQEYDTHYAIHGLCPESAAQFKHATRSKPTVLELAIMQHRQIISREEYHKRMRELGYLESEVRDEMFAITEQVPTMVDIIRFMVRDTDDPNVVNTFGLDTEFENKYGKQLKEWARDQGIPDEVALHNWRAHWTIPSPGQLFEFWHRLRDNPDFGGKEKLLQDIKDALIQQDILPYWHEHYLAISFRPMFRRDIRRAFEIGAINEKQVREAYIQLGHSDEVADTLTEFSVRLRDRRLSGHVAIKLWKAFSIDRMEVEQRLRADGIPDAPVKQVLDDAEQDFDKGVFAAAFASGDLDRMQFVNELTGIGVSAGGATKIANRVSLRIRSHPAMAGYKVGALTRTDAVSAMTASGMNTDITINKLDEIDLGVEYDLLQRCQQGIKGRFLNGEITKEEGVNEMRRRGTVEVRARQLGEEWDCEKKSIGRTIPTGKLCQLLEQGSINAVEFTERLRRMDYTADDASILTDNCLTAISERRAKLAAKEQKSIETAQRQEAARIARANAAVNREGKRLQVAREKAARVRKARERQLITAAEKVHDSCECDLFEAIGAVRVARAHVKETYGLTTDETLIVIIKAAEAMDKGSLESYAIAVDAFANEAATISTGQETNGQA